jgi:alkanesulfonate monooxygenase SsuD/methylene tetrahydromethanopterin reductase-like flavin-dependent oxidoreductase (luciferase family)
MRERGESTPMTGSDPKRFQILMEKMKEQMQFAEKIGYDGFCLTEQHMQVEGIETTTNPLFWDYFVAQHTKKMRVGQLGMNLTVVNPIQLAEDIAMLDHFTKGRVFAGFSRGNTPRWTATFGQHVNVMSTESDKSEADKRNRAIFYENWEIVKGLWTNDTIRLQGDFWKVPLDTPWEFNPTKDWGREGHVNSDGILQEVGIVPRPYQDPHPPVYAPFSYSMETAQFWAREGAKMVSMVSEDKEKFISITLERYMEEAHQAGRSPAPSDAIAIGGHLTMGRTEAETQDIYNGFEELFNHAYNAPPYHVPMGRLWKGNRQEVLDHVTRLAETYEVDEFFLWHHVGYFPQEQEMAMLHEFSEGVIQVVNA